MRIFITVSLLILLTSCASTNYYQQTINSWRGSSGQNLTSSWGTPQQIIKSGDGSQTFIYVTHPSTYYDNNSYQNIVFVANRKTIGAQVPSNQLPRTMMIGCTTIFSLNKQNIITHAGFQGGDCMGKANR